MGQEQRRASGLSREPHSLFRRMECKTWKLKSGKGYKVLHSLWYFEMEGYFNVPTVIRKCLKGLGNIPVIQTFN